MNDGTFMKTKNTVCKINQRIVVVLILVLVVGITKNLILWTMDNFNIRYLIKNLLIPCSAFLVSSVIQLIYTKYILKLKKNNVKKYLKQNQAWLYNIMLCLCMPISIPLWIYIISFALVTIYTIIEPKLYLVKINKTALGILFVALLLQLFQINFSNNINENLNLWLYGNEQILASSPLLLLLVFLFLSVTKTIKTKISITNILYSMTLYWFIGILCHFKPGFATKEVIVGSIFFLSIFVATDTLTSPVTPVGQTLYSLVIAIITLIFTHIIMLPKQVSMAIAIVISNLLTLKFDMWGSYVRGNVKRYSLISLIIIIFGFIIAFQISRYI